MKLSWQRRLLSFVAVGDGCWQWQGGKTRNGYGIFNAPPGMTRLAHRLMWLLFGGEIPEGLEIDHLCRNRACVKPSHLDLVTHRENTLRGDTVPARHAARTECPKCSGPLSLSRRGHRHCAPCTRKQKRETLRRWRAHQVVR